MGTEKPSEKERLRFRDELHKSKLSRSTLNQYGYSIKAYHSMLGEEVSYRRLNPNNYIPYYFTSDEVQKIFTVCDNLKHYTMLTVLFYGALRASELCSLNDEDVNLKDLTIRVREGKGGREGIAYITDECAAVIIVDPPKPYPIDSFNIYTDELHVCHESRKY